jgi:hypothetical protein
MLDLQVNFDRLLRATLYWHGRDMENVFHTPSDATIMSNRLVRAVAEVEVVTVRLVRGTGMIFRSFCKADRGSEQCKT